MYPRRPGRPRTAQAIRALVLEMARDNAGWGYRRSHGELTGLGYKLAPSTVWKILTDERINPAPQRCGQTWHRFLAMQAKTILAADFFHVDTRVPAPPVRAVLHRARHKAGPPGRHYGTPDGGVGDPAGPQPADEPRRPG